MTSKLLTFLIPALFSAHIVSAEEMAPADIEKLVENLASDSYQAREDATEKLWGAGEAALAALREASVSQDPEQSLRAAALLRKIELRITPETPATVLARIERYETAPANRKAAFLNELKRDRAYFQILKLYSMEDRADVRASLAPTIRGVAIISAREAIADGDGILAEELLKMSAGEPSDLMALACFYRNTGKLDAELENPSPFANVPTNVWKITALRAKGDLPGALELAASAKNPELLAGLKILTGDPTMWIRRNGFADRAQEAHPVYVEIALKRWSGRNIADSDFAPLLAGLDAADSVDKAWPFPHWGLWVGWGSWRNTSPRKSRTRPSAISFPRKGSPMPWAHMASIQ